jgi:hypothetical protein
MLFQMLLTLSIRFFLFDFVLFKGLRNYLRKKGYLFKKILNCPFCQGFWSGLGVFMATHLISFDQSFLLPMLSFGFVTAYLCMMTTAIFYPLIDKYEKYYDTL